MDLPGSGARDHGDETPSSRKPQREKRFKNSMSDTQVGSEVRPRVESVLVVDDDVRVVELLQITLGGRGYQVLSAYDGETALKTIQSHRPDLVVLDVRLPKRSGFEVLELVRQDAVLKSLPIVLVSANAATETRLQGLRLGADDYLTKPFSPRELIMKIRRLLDRAQDRRVLLMKNEALEDEVRRHRGALHDLHQELNRNLSRMGLLLGQVLDLNRTASLEQVLERFIATPVGGLDYSRLALLVRQRDGAFRTRATRGVEERALRGLRFSEGGFLLRVLRSVERPMRIEELAGYPEGREEMGRLAAAGMTLIVPAICDQELRGVLVLGERAQGELSRFDRKLVDVLAHSVAIALKNVELPGETERSFLQTTATLIATVEARYPFLEGHSERVTELALALGRRLVLHEDEMERLRYGALLHDLGDLPEYGELFAVPVHLSIEERERHRRESAERATALLGASGDGALGAILRHQHEWWNGSGFPSGLARDEIPLAARIVALVNAWDALTHPRPHRPAHLPTAAMAILRQRAGSQFDPELVSILEQVLLHRGEDAAMILGPYAQGEER